MNKFNPTQIATYFKNIAINMQALSDYGYPFGSQENHDIIQQFASNAYDIMCKHVAELYLNGLTQSEVNKND